MPSVRTYATAIWAVFIWLLSALVPLNKVSPAVIIVVALGVPATYKILKTRAKQRTTPNSRAIYPMRSGIGIAILIVVIVALIKGVGPVTLFEMTVAAH
jgi:hypothetical protein